ncbi:hypothetical protein [Nocardia sp. NPDC051463]
MVSGINAAIGYGVGCVLEWVYRRPRSSPVGIRICRVCCRSLSDKQ